MSAIAGRVLLIPKGAYDANITYRMLDVVSYGGNSYVAKQTTAGNTPSADNAYWMLLSAGSAVASINDIGDVLITSPTNGQVLKYNATTQKWENGQDTGGLLPHLIIISEAGEDVVKAVKGSTEIIATETSTGHYECDVPEFGIWTIHAVLNGDDAQVSLNVDTVKVYTVDDSHFHADINVTFPHSLGATCALSATGQTTQYATSSPYDFTVHEAGTYTLTVSYDGTDYTETITVTATGEEFEYLLPAPEDAPTGDINLWLFYADIDNSESTYSSLADILADTTALSALMASNDAVDYMIRNTSWISAITSDESAMAYIGLNNYASDSVIDDSDWFAGVLASQYFESVLNGKVPVGATALLTSGSWGTGNPRSENLAYIFDGNESTECYGPWVTTIGIGYDFTTPKKVRAFRYLYKVDHQINSNPIVNYSGHQFAIRYSDDGTTWTEAENYTGNSCVWWNLPIAIPDSGSHRYFDLLTKNQNVMYGFGHDITFTVIAEMQFYYREDV